MFEDTIENLQAIEGVETFLENKYSSFTQLYLDESKDEFVLILKNTVPVLSVIEDAISDLNKIFKTNLGWIKGPRTGYLNVGETLDFNPDVELFFYLYPIK